MRLLEQLVTYSEYVARVVVTYNKREDCKPASTMHYPFLLEIIENEHPAGFGANHNRAFRHCDSPFFCVMNPDIDIQAEPFGSLLSCYQNPSAAIVAPAIVDPVGKDEDNARYFPTPFALIKKAMGKDDGRFPADCGLVQYFPDWVAGMFLLFSSQKYRELSGFDESYFLYYEDVDICLRCWRHGYMVVLCKAVVVIHDARRTSHANLKYFRWHLTSILRFFAKHLGRFPEKNNGVHRLQN